VFNSSTHDLGSCGGGANPLFLTLTKCELRIHGEDGRRKTTYRVGCES
jgi:hypothetical protein